jgi:hypothetical protein
MFSLARPNAVIPSQFTIQYTIQVALPYAVTLDSLCTCEPGSPSNGKRNMRETREYMQERRK